MAISYQQTDAAGVGGVVWTTTCANTGVGFWADNADHFLPVVGGTPGTSRAETVSSSSTGNAIVLWEFGALPAGTTCPAGNWVVRHNITVANMNLTWDTCTVCRVTGAGATVIGNSSPAASFGSTGVKSTTISGSAAADFTGAEAIVIVLRGTNGAMSNQSYTWVRDQLIDTPLVAPVSFVPRNPAINHQNPGLLMEGRGWEKRNWMWLPKRPRIRRPELWLPNPVGSPA